MSDNFEHRYNSAPFCAKCSGPCVMPKEGYAVSDDFDLIDYEFRATFSVDPEFTDDPDAVARYIQDMLHDMLMDGYPFDGDNIKKVEA